MLPAVPAVQRPRFAKLHQQIRACFRPLLGSAADAKDVFGALGFGGLIYILYISPLSHQRPSRLTYDRLLTTQLTGFVALSRGRWLGLALVR